MKGLKHRLEGKRPRTPGKTSQVLSPPQATRARGNSGLVIESPQQGATVGMREVLIGRMQSDGWPVIFVQADIPGQPWWCQSPVTSVEHGEFRSAVVFGDEQTPHGMQFRVVAVVAPTREAAHNFKLGAKHLVLPDGLPHTDEVVVSRK